MDELIQYRAKHELLRTVRLFDNPLFDITKSF